MHNLLTHVVSNEQGSLLSHPTGIAGGVGGAGGSGIGSSCGGGGCTSEIGGKGDEGKSTSGVIISMPGGGVV